jgi:hypothetical protein
LGHGTRARIYSGKCQVSCRQLGAFVSLEVRSVRPGILTCLFAGFRVPPPLRLLQECPATREAANPTSSLSKEWPSRDDPLIWMRRPLRRWILEFSMPWLVPRLYFPFFL